MVIDYATLKKQKEAELKGMMAKPVSMEGIQSSVDKARNDFLTQTGIQGSAALGEATQLPSLQRKTASTVQKTGYDINRLRQDRMFNELMNLALDKGATLDQAKQFAYNSIQQMKEQQFQSAEAQKARNFKDRMSAMGDKYSEAGIALQNQYQPSYDPNGAILRMLLGTGTMVGLSGYYQSQLNKSINAPKTVVTQPVAGQSGYAPYDYYYEPATSASFGRTAGTEYQR